MLKLGFLLPLLYLLYTMNSVVHGRGMVEVFRWKQMDYYNRDDGLGLRPTNTAYKTSSGNTGNNRVIVFPSVNSNDRKKREDKVTSRDQPNFESRWSGARETYDNGVTPSYIAYNNVPMGVTHYKGRLFLTMPRRRVGIPSTLNYIDMVRDGNKESPLLNAYPNIETNRLKPNGQPNSNGIISVYRTTVDACQRLWFIDTGMLEYPDNRTQVQPPSIWMIDLNTNRVLKRYEIPTSIVDTGRGLASIAIDVDAQQCGAAFAYIPDLVNNQLFVYSLEQNKMWAFSHNYFRFDPLAGDLSIGGQEFRWDDGIFSITLGPLQSNGERTVYFHPMASNNEFYVSNQILQNEMNAARSDHGRDFKILGSRGERKQSTMHFYDPKTGVIFYDEIHRNGVGCWNTNKPFSAANHDTVHEDAQKMIYPSDLTIDDDGTMWVMSNSMPIFIYSELDTNVYNFRVWKQSTTKAIEKTLCK